MREVVITGVGLHPWGMFEDKSVIDMAIQATNAALSDAGLAFSDIQSICAGGSEYVQVLGRGMLGNVLLDMLGGSGIDVVSIKAGCSGSAMVYHTAFLEIASGRKDIVLAVGADKNPRGLVVYNIPKDIRDRNYVIGRAVGAGNPAFWAMNIQRRIIEYGTTEEQLAKVAVKAHKNGALNQYARYRKVITLEEVLASPMVADPLRLLEVCPFSHGAAAVVFCSAEKARQLTTKPVYVATTALGTKQYGEPLLETDLSMMVNPAAPYSNCSDVAVWRAYEQAGIGPKDISLIEMADLSVWHEFKNLEEWGFCKHGEAEAMFERGDTEINGRLPVNPSGGFQSFGEATAACGMWQMAEIVWQLRGQAGQRQVKNPKAGLCEVRGLGPTAGVAILKI